MTFHALPLRRRLFGTALASTAALFASCGGGGGGGDAQTPAPPPAAVKPVTLSGTAATGAAIANGSVEARCVQGTATTKTAANGSYSIDVSSLTVPCALRITSADGTTVLHSIAYGAVATITANITPASELVVARLTGGSPAAFFATFDATAAAALPDSKVKAADAAVVDMLKNAGIDLTPVGGSALSGTLVAANGASTGNAYDKALDKLDATLASNGTTLAAFAGTVAQGSPAAPPVASGAVPSLPPDLALNPAAASCPSLRSGNYRLTISGVGRSWVKIDAQTLNYTETDDAGNVGAQLTLVDNGNCHFAGGHMAVSPAGVIVLSSQAGSGGQHGSLLFPAQKHAVADLAGEWNFIGMDRNGPDTTPITLMSSTVTIDGTGTVTAMTYCTDVATGCQAAKPGHTITANPSGSFNVRGPDGSSMEGFAYRSGSGEMMLHLLAVDAYLIGVRKATLALPGVGQLNDATVLQLETMTFPDFKVTDTRSTVTAVDGAAGRYTRSSVYNLATGVSRPETIAINEPSTGFLHRLPGIVTDSSGAASTVRETVTLNLPGAGLSVTAFVGGTALQLAVSK